MAAYHLHKYAKLHSEGNFAMDKIIPNLTGLFVQKLNIRLRFASGPYSHTYSFILCSLWQK